MEIQIYNPTQAQPLPEVRWNYEEVKGWVQAGLDCYKGRVYTEDTVREAKVDRAALNKLANALDDKRKELKSAYLAPYATFEAQVKELAELVKKQSDSISEQIENFDKLRRQEKEAECRNLYDQFIGDLAPLVPYEKLQNPRWLNITYSLTQVMNDIRDRVAQIQTGLEALDALEIEPGIREQVKGVFLRDFDISAALTESQRIKERQEALERYNTAQVAQNQRRTPEANGDMNIPLQAQTRYSDENSAEKIHTVTFRIRVTESKLRALGEYMRENGIMPERV